MPLGLSLIINQTAASGSGELSYFSPRGRTTKITAVHVTNPSASEERFRLAIVVNGGAAVPGDYIYWDVPVGPNDTFTTYTGWILAPRDKLFIEDGSEILTFTVNGEVIS